MTRREQMTAYQRAYEQTAKGKAAKKRYNERRIWLSQRDVMGVAATAEQAQAINAHIQRRKREFIARQSSGTETQSV